MIITMILMMTMLTSYYPSYFCRQMFLCLQFHCISYQLDLRKIFFLILHYDLNLREFLFCHYHCYHCNLREIPFLFYPLYLLKIREYLCYLKEINSTCHPNDTTMIMITYNVLNNQKANHETYCCVFV